MSEAAVRTERGARAPRAASTGARQRQTRAVRAPRWLKPALFVLCLVPAIWVVWALYSDFARTTSYLGANPITEAEHFTGKWTLRFLMVTLAVTPLRRLTGWNWLVRYRRMFGLFAFSYAALHLSMYIGVDMFFDFGDIVHDVVKHPYITIGMAAFLLLIPLAVTSTNAMVRRLGGARWRSLHRLVYVVAVLGVIHFWWAVKKDITEPLIYAIIFGLLYAARLIWMAANRRARQAES
ncbi:MAG TPA: protein-methionine-sulfoxide reductase heme-binding subunit MsrQ [Gemmatimonadaceae bacterium]|nr:protein-methionine-sulfoxide reductase heme-binding subunit MsrQ [Gemmatimonadaceae bacterium]